MSEEEKEKGGILDSNFLHAARCKMHVPACAVRFGERGQETHRVVVGDALSVQKGDGNLCPPSGRIAGSPQKDLTPHPDVLLLLVRREGWKMMKKQHKGRSGDYI